jgi:hypothetical protein
MPGKNKELNKKDVLIILMYGVYFFLIATPLIIPFINYVYQDIFLMAYFSYYSECNAPTIQEGIKDLNEQGYSVSIAGTYNPINNSIFLNEYLNNEEYFKTLKHEKIHQYQYKHKRYFSCDNSLGAYLNEVEAYLFENLDDKTFNYFYPD